MKRFFCIVLTLVIGIVASASAQLFNPVNNYLVSGNGYAFTGISDTNRNLIQLKLKTLDLFQQRLRDWKQKQPVASDYSGLDTLFRHSAFEACMDVILQSEMVRVVHRGDSVLKLIRKDQFHSAVGTYDTVRGMLPVYLWCQGFAWMDTLVVPLEEAAKKAYALDRYSYYVLLPNWGLSRGNLCPTRFSENSDFAVGSERFFVPEKMVTPIRFTLRDLLPDATLPDISFDYTTEAQAYLSTIRPDSALLSAPSQKPLTLRSSERMPEFKGDIQRYLATHLRYPPAAQRAGVEGLLMLIFVVSETGQMQDIRIERGTGNTLLDSEGIRVLEGMPAWKPGYQRDSSGKMQAVSVYYRIPLVFALQ